MYVLTGFGIASPEPPNLFLRHRLIRHDPRLLIPFSAADRRIASAGRARRALLVSYFIAGKSRGGELGLEDPVLMVECRGDARWIDELDAREH
ncbi:MAG: hypothetical protein DMG32_03065 [Acidobacteria bacterium]|nr:MAG: hypothetical protein DMG32_03065 [Acidobacteriota bacterium]